MLQRIPNTPVWSISSVCCGTDRTHEVGIKISNVTKVEETRLLAQLFCYNKIVENLLRTIQAYLDKKV